MKQITIPLATFLLLTSSQMAFSKKIDIQKNYIKVMVLDKGVKRFILIQKEDSQQNKMSTYSTKQLDSKEGVIIAFKNPSEVQIHEFETKYGLKLKEKLIIGYYIFQNISDVSDTQIIADIIKNETNIKTIKPNWKKRNLPR